MQFGGEDAALRRLREALAQLAAQDARELLDEARVHARNDVRELLARALRQSMLTVIENDLQDGAAERHPLTGPEPAGALHGSAVYVYGVVSAGAEMEELPAGVEGLGGVRGVSESGLTALISDVDGGEFAEGRLREHMADVAWVQDIAHRHETVIEAIGIQETVIPMRMCTVYETEEDIRELLRRESRGLREALRYLDGKAEWGVKVFVHPFRTSPPASSAAEYLQRRDGERAARAEAARRADDAAKHVHEVLCAVATDSLIVSPQEYEAREHPGELLVNGVYLVPDAAREDFREQAQALARAFTQLGLDIELTGPWPAYNFVPGTIGATW